MKPWRLDHLERLPRLGLAVGEIEQPVWHLDDFHRPSINLTLNAAVLNGRQSSAKLGGAGPPGWPAGQALAVAQRHSKEVNSARKPSASPTRQAHGSLLAEALGLLPAMTADEDVLARADLHALRRRSTPPQAALQSMPSAATHAAP